MSHSWDHGSLRTSLGAGGKKWIQYKGVYTWEKREHPYDTVKKHFLQQYLKQALPIRILISISRYIPFWLILVWLKNMNFAAERYLISYSVWSPLLAQSESQTFSRTTESNMLWHPPSSAHQPMFQPQGLPLCCPSMHQACSVCACL